MIVLRGYFPAERAAWVAKRATAPRTASPQRVSHVLSQALRQLRRSVPEAKLREAARHGPTSVVSLFDLTAWGHRLREALEEELQRTANDQAQREAKRLKLNIRKATPRAVAQMRFDLINPLTSEFARDHAGALVVDITNDARDGIARLVTNAFQQGITVDDVAQRLFNSTEIGLLPQHQAAVHRLYESSIAGGMPVTQAAAIAERYSNRLLDYRTTNIARTELIAASSAGQNAVWDVAQEIGLLPANAKRQWVVTPDDRLCPMCEAMDGQERELGEPFTSKDVGELEGPPLHPQCRCALSMVSELLTELPAAPAAAGEFPPPEAEQLQPDLTVLAEQDTGIAAQQAADWTAEQAALAAEEAQAGTPVGQAEANYSGTPTHMEPRFSQPDLGALEGLPLPDDDLLNFLIESREISAEELNDIRNAMVHGRPAEKWMEKFGPLRRDALDATIDAAAEMAAGKLTGESVSSYHQLWDGWSADSNNAYSAVLKRAAELEFDTQTVYHHGSTWGDVMGESPSRARVSYERGIEDGLARTGLDLETARWLLRADYSAAQAMYAKMGIKELTLYRGVSEIYFGSVGMAVPKLGEVGELYMNSLSSWSTSQKVAQDFGGYVIEMKIPVKDIAQDTYTTNSLHRHSEEREVVVVGRPRSYRLVQRYSEKLEKAARQKAQRIWLDLTEVNSNWLNQPHINTR